MTLFKSCILWQESGVDFSLILLNVRNDVLNTNTLTHGLPV